MATGQKLAEPYLFRNTFDRSSGRHKSQAGAQCRLCHKTEWRNAPSPGWGRKLFGATGWVLGNGPSRHVCPECDALRKSGVHREGRVVTDPAVLLTSPTAPPPDPPTAVIPEPVNTQLSEALAPVKATMEKPKVQTFVSFQQASSHARKVLRELGVEKPSSDVNFRVTGKPGEWSIVLLGDHHHAEIRPPKRRISPEGTRSRTSKPNTPLAEKWVARIAAERMLSTIGVFAPVSNVDYRLKSLRGGKWAYQIIGHHVPGVTEAPAAPKSLSGVTRWGGYLASYDARKAAVKQLAALHPHKSAPQEGVDFWVYQDSGNLWGYTTENPIPPAPALPAPRKDTRPTNSLERAMSGPWRPHGGRADPRILRPGQSRPTRANIAKSAIRYLRATGAVEVPIEDVHYRVLRDADRWWRYEITEPTPQQQIIEKEPTVSDGSTQAVPDAESVPHAEPARPSTPADSRRIRDALDNDYYDEANERYKGDWNDARVAEAMKVPRAWVTRVREIYGPDRNDGERLAAAAKLAAQKAQIEALETKTREGHALADTVIELSAKLNNVMSEIDVMRRGLGL